MKKIIALVLVLAMSQSLCAWGKGETAPKEADAADTLQQTETEKTRETVAIATTEAEVYAEDFFAVEDINYKKNKSEIRNINIKIRNTTSENVIRLYFRVQALETRGDILEARNMGSSDRMDAGQAYWFYCGGEAFEDCKPIEEAGEKSGFYQNPFR